MGLIKNYLNNLLLSSNDKLIGSAGEEGSTKNFRLGDIAEFVDQYSSKYSVYTATIKAAAGGGAPTATIMENTIGNIVWTRNSAGTYTGTLSSGFGDPTKFWLIGRNSDIAYSDIIFYQFSGTEARIKKVDNLDGLSCYIEIRIYH